MALLLNQKNIDDSDGQVYPLVAIRHGVIFPHTESIIQFARPKSVAGVQAAYEGNKKIIFASQKDSKVSEPEAKDLYTIGTLCEIERTLQTNGEMNAFVRGLSRVRVETVKTDNPSYLQAIISDVPEIVEDNPEVQALIKHITAEFKKAVNLGKAVDIMNFMKLMSGVGPSELADQIASTLDIKTSEKQQILETTQIKERLKLISEFISHEIKILEIERNIASKTQKKFDKNMRDTVLRERLKTIQKELGEEGDEDQEIALLRKKLKKSGLPLKAYKKVAKELNRLDRMSPHNPEASYIRTWVETILEVPWKSGEKLNVSITKAQKVLNSDHYGLDEVKERIIEYLAVLKLKADKLSKSKKIQKKSQVKVPTVLCFVGPPGVGKTSIGRSIAKALGREFVKMSLGGMRDEAEIRGHRRTYVGAMPGRIIQGMRNSGTKNPVFMLDEIDKVGSDFRGDPSSALLEVLDPEQNDEFTDHYLEIPYDLSEVIFITTANTLDTIPPALRDRLELIRFSGYTIAEKRQIAKKYLFKKNLNRNGLTTKDISIEDEAYDIIIQRYTREAGVRNLEREISKIFRKIARRRAEGKKSKISITPKNVSNYLGAYKYQETFAELEDEIGLATGMAWTQAGGDILFVEVALMPGRGKLILTGQLGDVMKESAEAAFSYIRSRWQNLKLDKDFYKKIDIHVHVPEGAIPKDGPSAGITLTTSIVSALTRRPVRRDVSMTGEVTLRGRVLEIGGVKEKVIAAHRAGIKTILLPKENKKDIVKIPKEIKDEISFKFVSHMDQVLRVALKKKA